MAVCTPRGRRVVRRRWSVKYFTALTMTLSITARAVVLGNYTIWISAVTLQFDSIQYVHNVEK